MVNFAVAAPARPLLDIVGLESKFPVRRVYCIGKNYVAHIREMNADERDPPVIFMKPTDSVLPNGGDLPYPVFTENLHYEGELIVTLKSGGYNIPVREASRHIYGYAVGLDMTRRDHQASAMSKGHPWEVTKAFDQSAPIGPITRIDDCGELSSGQLRLAVNGEVRQDADISLMIWKVDEIISKISEQYQIFPGDVILTGTPAGVGAVVQGDVIDCSMAHLTPLQVRIGPRAA